MKHENVKLGIPDQEGQLRIMFSKGGPRAGAGRKGFGVTKKISLTLSQELWETLEQRSTSLNCSRSETVRDIIEAFFLHDSGDKDVQPNAD
ncbi:ribbon-helix-helix domain-containing protein [Paenibacillus mendelii]|uniref:CopG family transcriptional regulator n=1 Tax=Paenibacillus mendelii TaxID=206163 RepID=A0ABV6J443_9BACL|nr:CopG family transcriptional regulator [Paenibacillus mendelii]MCQ6561829.1 ribbon-helix-helix domain-containing protein [Paenibacillus mendelii]